MINNDLNFIIMSVKTRFTIIHNLLEANKP